MFRLRRRLKKLKKKRAAVKRKPDAYKSYYSGAVQLRTNGQALIRDYRPHAMIGSDFYLCPYRKNGKFRTIYQYKTDLFICDELRNKMCLNFEPLRKIRLHDYVDGISWMMSDPENNALYVSDLQYTVVYRVDVTPNMDVTVTKAIWSPSPDTPEHKLLTSRMWKQDSELPQGTRPDHVLIVVGSDWARYGYACKTPPTGPSAKVEKGKLLKRLESRLPNERNGDCNVRRAFYGSNRMLMENHAVAKDTKNGCVVYVGFDNRVWLIGPKLDRCRDIGYIGPSTHRLKTIWIDDNRGLLFVVGPTLGIRVFSVRPSDEDVHYQLPKYKRKLPSQRRLATSERPPEVADDETSGSEAEG